MSPAGCASVADRFTSSASFVVTSQSTRFRAIRSLAAALFGGAGLLLCTPQPAVRAAPATATLGVGATFDTLQVGAQIYRHVHVRSVNARTIVITHAEGLASLHLRDLSPELQAAFGYNPNADAAAEAALDEAQHQAEEQHARELAERAKAAVPEPSGNAQFDRMLLSFSHPPEIRPGIDLRPRFFALALNVKNQGPRPSCAVFAIISALEYENAQLTGKPARFSEEYLLWATCKTLGRISREPGAPATGETDGSDPTDPVDEGFALSEVVTALRAYGVPLFDEMPYTGGRASDINPSPEMIMEARSHRRVSIFRLPGHDNAARLANLVHSLNAGVPVAIGLQWPQYRTIRSGYLSEQQPLPGNGHAVTIVGYQNKTGQIADTVFIFKNSWGARWGAAGYGYVTYGYLVRNLVDTALLEVEAGEPSRLAPAR